MHGVYWVFWLDQSVKKVLGPVHFSRFSQITSLLSGHFRISRRHSGDLSRRCKKLYFGHSRVLGARLQGLLKLLFLFGFIPLELKCESLANGQSVKVARIPLLLVFVENKVILSKTQIVLVHLVLVTIRRRLVDQYTFIWPWRLVDAGLSWHLLQRCRTAEWHRRGHWLVRTFSCIDQECPQKRLEGRTIFWISRTKVVVSFLHDSTKKFVLRLTWQIHPQKLRRRC